MLLGFNIRYFKENSAFYWIVKCLDLFQIVYLLTFCFRKLVLVCFRFVYLYFYKNGNLVTHFELLDFLVLLFQAIKSLKFFQIDRFEVY
ncbi:hypothetical protein J2X77_000887 [Sphingobacterium sp. 2149]|nr:hypothetical protein [Sphingobacterium sp. 2149]